MSAPLHVVGMDCETSAVSLTDGARLVQAGFAMWHEGRLEVFCELVGWADGMLWDEGAQAVHGIARHLVDAASPAPVVDRNARRWLVERGVPEDRPTLVTAGFNVGSFDHPFFRHALPSTMELVSHRVLDLNSVLFVLDGTDPGGGPRSWEWWKDAGKDAAAEVLERHGISGREHDAGYDAAQALVMVEWLRDQVADNHVIL